MFALVDCNNFYCSCERAFDPSLQSLPVAVLSNNDGCVIARSEEVKAAGIRMGTPAFKVRDQLRENGVRLFSSNYTLYADMSRRVMDLLGEFALRMEVYSIDEAFLDLSDVPAGEVEGLCRRLQVRVKRCTGIPVGVGVGTTKTLAKVANHYAKKHRCQTAGVKILGGAEDIEAVLSWCKVADVWGVGRAHGPRLMEQGIQTAKDLRDADAGAIRRQMTVVGHRTVMELRGMPCIELETMPVDRKGVASTRSFGQVVTRQEHLMQAIATFVSRATFKLRRDKMMAGHLQVFVQTDRFRTECPQYANSVSANLPTPTAEPGEVTAHARRLLPRIYRPGYGYKKAGVMLTDLSRQGDRPVDLFASVDRSKRSELMKAHDVINDRFGRGTVGVASALGAVDAPWRMKRQHLSRRYTTCWDELLEVK